jgi:hypothetical protein
MDRVEVRCAWGSNDADSPSFPSTLPLTVHRPLTFPFSLFYATVDHSLVLLFFFGTYDTLTPNPLYTTTPTLLTSQPTSFLVPACRMQVDDAGTPLTT